MPKGVYVRTEENTCGCGRYVRTPAIKAQTAASLIGRHHTEEHNAAISASMMGIVRSDETKARMSKPKSPKHIANMSGPNNHNWKGGDSLNYGPDWNTQRRLALERDGYTCQRCGKPKSVLGQNPDVHHKVPYRKTQDNSLGNLISLCKSCHLHVEQKRTL